MVIILEKFEEQLVQLQEAFQWTVSKRWIYKKRTTKRRRANITEDAMALIRDQNALDSELYQHAVQVATALTDTAVAAAKAKSEVEIRG